MAAVMIAWDWAGRALESESGDLHVVAPFAGGVLVALIDGLGHGPEAALAARAAATILESQCDQTVEHLLRECHAGLRRTRGAAMTVASFTANDATMTWTGIGNVDGVLIRATPGMARASVPMRGGVVGYQLPTPRIETLRLSYGDTLILATDGIDSHFSDAASTTHPPAEVAKAIIARYFKGTDDAGVLVVRYSGDAL